MNCVIKMEYKKSKNKFSLFDQKRIALAVQERKRKYEEDKKNPEINKVIWNEKRKKWVHPFTQTGYIQPTVRKVFIDLKDEKSDTNGFKRATKFVSRCLEKLQRGEFALEENCGKNKYRLMGAGPKKQALEVRYALFDYFVDIRSSLKGCLPQLILLSKAKQLHEEYCELKRHAGEEPKELKITRQ